MLTGYKPYKTKKLPYSVKIDPLYFGNSPANISAWRLKFNY